MIPPNCIAKQHAHWGNLSTDIPGGISSKNSIHITKSPKDESEKCSYKEHVLLSLE